MKKRYPKILLAAGGTGGHLLPAQKIQAALSDCCEVKIAGVGLRDEGVALPGGPLHPKSLAKIAQGYFAAEKLLRQFQPDLLIGFGSYHSFPLVLAGYRRHIPLWLFEANCVMGRVNGLFSKKAKVFSLLPSHFATPISFPQKTFVKKHGKLPTVLVMGGSQGAQALNEKIPSLLDEIPGIQVHHITGKNKQAVYRTVSAKVVEYEHEMETLYCHADFVIARAGANTVSELLHRKIPSLLIPLPTAVRDHQRANAMYLQSVGAATVVEEERLTGAVLKKAFASRHLATFPEQNFPDFIELIRKELL